MRWLIAVAALVLVACGSPSGEPTEELVAQGYDSAGPVLLSESPSYLPVEIRLDTRYGDRVELNGLASDLTGPARLWFVHDGNGLPAVRTSATDYVSSVSGFFTAGGPTTIRLMGTGGHVGHIYVQAHAYRTEAR